MSTLVCLYVIGITALVAAGAAAVEWGVQGRIPARHIWSVAIVAALVVPPAALVQHARITARPPTAPAEVAFVQVVHLGRAAGTLMGAREPGTPLNRLRDEYRSVAARVSHVSARGIIAGWIAASLALIAWIGFGVAYWHRARREWEETELDGVSVHLSDETGPAVLGVLSQRIVLPAWAQTLAPEYRRLMLAHECEHIAARDPQRLACALAALVAMPWNPVLWWCAARLRRAIEMDCDARVLRRHPSPRAYGHLLLQVAARGSNAGPLAVPLVNLLRLPSELELRLRAMARPRTVVGRTALIGAACAVAAVSAAFTAPVPRVTRTTIRNLRQAAQTRLARGGVIVGTTVVRVGSTVLQLDSARVDARRGIVQGRLRELRGAAPSATHAADTIPSAIAEDSLATLTRVLRTRTRQVDSLRARVDSMSVALRARDARHAAREIVQIDKQGRPGALPGLPGDTWRLDDGGLGRVQVKFRENTARLNGVINRYYPSLAGTATPRTTIVFLADSAGRVLQTMSREYTSPPVMSAERAPEWFSGVSAGDVDFVSMQRWDVGTLPISVGWIELKH